MAKQTINLGTIADDGTGDTLRAGGDKINDNFDELYTFDLGLSTGSSPQFAGINLGHASDTTITRTGAGDIAVEGNAIYRAGGVDVPLADGGTGASLADPGADRVLFWDDSAGAVTWLAMGANLTITGTTLDATGGGGSAIEVLDEGVTETAALVSLDFVGAGVTANDDGSGNVTVTIAGGGGSGIDIEDEGVAESTGATTLNFTGAGVTANDVGGGQVDIAIPGVGGGNPTESIIIACGDESTAITTGTGKVTFRMPYAFTLSAVRASVNTAPTGSTIIIDINEAGSTILSTKLSIDASEKTSTTAASAAVISDTSLADDAEISIDFDQVGSTVAGAGVKVVLIGART